VYLALFPTKEIYEGNLTKTGKNCFDKILPCKNGSLAPLKKVKIFKE
jgi:hypothetical protein